MKAGVVVLAILLGASSFQLQARPSGCKNTTEKEIEGLFDRWNDSLKTGDVEKVVANYAPKSILLPSLSNSLYLTPKSKAEYFKYFLEKKPVGKIDMRAIEIDCNSAIDTGLYTFTLDSGVSTAARYTFTYMWNGKKWLISSHHSSVLPDGNPAARMLEKP